MFAWLLGVLFGSADENSEASGCASSRLARLEAEVAAAEQQLLSCETFLRRVRLSIREARECTEAALLASYDSFELGGEGAAHGVAEQHESTRTILWSTLQAEEKRLWLLREEVEERRARAEIRVRCACIQLRTARSLLHNAASEFGAGTRSALLMDHSPDDGVV